MLKKKEIGSGQQKIYIHRSTLVQMRLPVDGIQGRQGRVPVTSILHVQRGERWWWMYRKYLGTLE